MKNTANEVRLAVILNLIQNPSKKKAAPELEAAFDFSQCLYFMA